MSARSTAGRLAVVVAALAAAGASTAAVTGQGVDAPRAPAALGRQVDPNAARPIPAQRFFVGGTTSADGEDSLDSVENVIGSDFGDTLFGGKGDNLLDGRGGNDILQGGKGNDILDGGGGIDTAVYENLRETYTIVATASGFTISETGGTDTLSDIEPLKFSTDGLAFDLDPGMPADNTVRVIGAAFDGPAIGAHPEWVSIGLQFFDSGMSMLQVCSLVAQLLGQGNTAFVNTVYENVMDVAPTPEVRDFFVGLLQGSGGTMTQGQFLELAALAPQNDVNIDLVGLEASGVVFI